MMPRFAGSCSEMVVGRFFGFGTDLCRHEIKSFRIPRGKYAHVRRRLESSGYVAYKRGKSMQGVSTKMDSKANTVYDSLWGAIH
jgi:hypothetical protein